LHKMPGKRGKIRERKIGIQYLLMALFICFLDQLSKFWVTKALEIGESISIVRGIFHITLVHNRGAAFGILRQHPYLFVAVAAISAIFIAGLILLRPHKLTPAQKTALCFILGGAIGNLTDRIRLGYVVDFIDFRIWPVFNLADSFITVGAVMLGVLILRKKRCTG